MRERIEKFYEEKVEGIIVRSRARWHEHGECTEVLNSFPPNKVPGNDGLLVEFYKMFCASIGNRLVECFNVSFEKGELSSSQKQAVITLIEIKDLDRSDLKKLEADFSFKR